MCTFEIQPPPTRRWCMLSGRIHAARFERAVLLDRQNEFVLELMNDEFGL